MSHRLALEVGAEVEVLKKVYFFFFFFQFFFFPPHLLLLVYLIIKGPDGKQRGSSGGVLLPEICSFFLLGHYS